MDLNKTINVKNRGDCEAGYTLQDSGVRRNWMPGEIKKGLTVGELEQATYIPGGRVLIEKYLLINDPEVCEYLGIRTEPEYYYDEPEIRTLLTTGTIEQLEDCLDFAPEGVLDLIKKISVELKINDISKRDAIRTKMGFDITRALDNIDYANSKETTETHTGRRAEPIKAATSEVKEGRKAAPVVAPKSYNRAK